MAEHAHAAGFTPMPGLTQARLLLGIALAASAAGVGGGAAHAQPLDAGSRIAILSELARDYPWFQKQKDEILARCEQHLSQPMSTTWETIPGQEIPRSNHVNTVHGCPTCGDAINRGYGYYPWRFSRAHPWKVQCPKCGERFPKNDFPAYYRSGLDAHGRFSPERADSSLLVNPEHPDPNDPRHRFGVDPGAGYRSPEGILYTFVPCYNGSAFWGRPWTENTITQEALDAAHAYALTGDTRFARHAATILSRVASIYPDMNYGFWSAQEDHNPGGRLVPGKIQDRIWENFLVRRLLRVYGLIHDAVAKDQEFLDRLAPRLGHLDLDTAAYGNPFTSLIEHNYLREIFRCAQQGVLWGNTGMTEENVSLLALVTQDESFRGEVRTWLLAPRTITDYNTERHRQHGGGLPDLVLGLTRDGFSWESGGYCNILPKALMPIYPAFSALVGGEASPVQAAVRDLCRLRLGAFSNNHYTMICLERFRPYWGDNGTFCDAAHPDGVTPELYFNAFLVSGDSASAGHVKAILAAGDRPADELLRIDDLYLLPPDIRERMETFSRATPETPRESANLTGRGLVLLKQGTGADERCLWTHYGNNHTCHNYPDTTALGLFAWGRDILPRLGYPDLKQRSLHRNWHLSAICNNTVVVDGQEGMRRIDIANQTLHSESDLLSLCVIDATAIYEQVSRYERSFGLVHCGEAGFYVFDFFAVAGGRDHVYSFHSGEGDLVPDPAIAFTPQAAGTYAGSAVSYGAEAYRYSETYNWRWGNGFQYLYDVARANPVNQAELVWKLVNTHGVSPHGDQVRCRLHLLTPLSELALAKGKPPQNTKGNPEFIHYVLARRSGTTGLESDFAAVIEPHLEGRRPVSASRRLETLSGGPFATAIEVTLADGRRDLIARNPDEQTDAHFAGGLRLKGRFCLLRLGPDGRVREYHVAGAETVSLDGVFHLDAVPSVTARVAAFERGVSATCTLTLDHSVALPEEALSPLWAEITPTAPEIDGTYRIVGTEQQGGKTILHLDADSFIAGPRDDSVSGRHSLADAFRYAFAEGAAVTIPLSYHGRPGKHAQ